MNNNLQIVLVVLLAIAIVAVYLKLNSKMNGMNEAINKDIKDINEKMNTNNVLLSNNLNSVSTKVNNIINGSQTLTDTKIYGQLTVLSGLDRPIVLQDIRKGLPRGLMLTSYVNDEGKEIKAFGLDGNRQVWVAPDRGWFITQQPGA